MKNNSDNKRESRRKFFTWSFLAGLAALAMPSAVRAASRTPAPEAEKIRLITPDGRVMEVDKKRLPTAAMPGAENRATNEELKAWLEGGKNN